MYQCRPRTPMVPWTWQQMVAQLDDFSLRDVLGHSRGFVSCRVEKTDERDYNFIGSGVSDALRRWAFRLVREDAAHVFLYPDCRAHTRTVECVIKESWETAYMKTLKFDTSKLPMAQIHGKAPFAKKAPPFRRIRAESNAPPLKAPPPQNPWSAPPTAPITSIHLDHLRHERAKSLPFKAPPPPPAG